MRTRALVQRRLLPERHWPYDLTQVWRPSWPHGHEVAGLGTFPDEDTRDRVARARRDLLGTEAAT